MADWQNQGALSPAHLAALTAAVAAAGGKPASEAPAPAVRAVPEAVHAAVFGFLLDARAAGGAGALSDDAMIFALGRMIDGNPGGVTQFVREHAGDPRRRAHWIRILPQSMLARIIALLAPARPSSLLPAAEILMAAWRAANAAPAEPGLMWDVVLMVLAEPSSAGDPLDRLVDTVLDRTAGSDANLRARLLGNGRRLAAEAGHAGLRLALDRQGSAGAPSRVAKPRWSATGPEQDRSRAKRPARRDRGRTAFGLDGDDAAERGAPIYIGNAGLVLAGPFLPHLFKTLDMLSDGPDGKPRLRDAEAVSRAVHLLQYLVDGRTAAPEPLLVLNKILCGVAPAVPIARAIEPSEAERGSATGSSTRCWRLGRSSKGHR